MQSFVSFEGLILVLLFSCEFLGGARLQGVANRFAAYWTTMAGGYVVARSRGVGGKLLWLEILCSWLLLPVL